MITKDNPTLLSLVGMGVPPYSARGLTQSLAPISSAAHLERTINGELLDLGYAPFQKYASTISGSDQRPPACDGVWPGKIIIVDCIAELAVYGTPPFGRDPVDYDSIRFENGYSYYRPRLTMMVMNWSMDADEWAAGVSWSLNLEEHI